MKIKKQVFNTIINSQIDEIIKINNQKTEEYKGESMYSTFELSEKLNFLSGEKLLFVRGIADKISRISSLYQKGFDNNSVHGETIFDTCNDLVNYTALLNDYILMKNGNESKYTEFFDEIRKCFDIKNGDYSNGEDDALSNFSIIEYFGLGSIESGILGRISIKIQRIANFLSHNNYTYERIHEEFIDLAVYTLIFSGYLKFKNDGQINEDAGKKYIQKEVLKNKILNKGSDKKEEIKKEEVKEVKNETIEKKKENNEVDLSEIDGIDFEQLAKETDFTEIGKKLTEKEEKKEEKKEESSSIQEINLEDFI